MKTKIRLAFASLFLGILFCLPAAQAQSGRQANAIWIRDSAKVANLTYHTSGISDSDSTARANIVDTAKCSTAETSNYADPGETEVWLHSGMLSTIKTLATTYGYSMLVTEYAGGDHSSGSYHYRGTAFDVATINGRGVSSSNPYWRSFNQRCRDRGAVEVLGPGFPGHSTHVHNAWPSGTSASSAGGCLTQVSAPSGLNATTVDHDSIKITWNDNSSINTAQLLQKSGTSSTGPWSTAASLGANTESHTESGLGSGKKYWFRVRASNSSDTSPWSNVDNATTKDVKPGAPSALTATAVSNDQINLAWTGNSSNEDGFRIYRSTDSTNYTLIKTVGINATSYSNTGLSGNRKYWFKVAAYNTAGNSAYSNVASDTTAPQAPTALTAAAGAVYSEVKLSWTDNANSETGFKIERGTAVGGPFTAIGTNVTSDTTYTDTGRAATTAYYYRVRAYNANGNSDYSNVAGFTTGNAPPVLAAVGNKTVAAGSALSFTATATDPNANVVTTTWQTFQSFPHGAPMESVLFNRPQNSASTSAFQDTSTNYTLIRSNHPAGNGSTRTLKAGWGFKTGMANYWVRLNTFNVPTNMNPTVGLDQMVRFKIHSSKAIKVGLGIRETGTAAAYGANGGTTGAIEWVGVTNVVSGHPVPSRLVAANTWTTLSFNIPFESVRAFTGDGVVPQTGKGVLEHIVLRGEGGTGAYAVYFDDFAVVAQNTLSYTLDAGAPSGASIGRKTGVFSWTPTTGQAGLHNITVRVTDQLGAVDFETIKVTVTGIGNNPPSLGAIGNKSVNEGSALTFTATATDPDASQTKTFTLDAGAPSGASITTGGAFSWTPTEAQGPGTFPITVRVTDNGSPVSNDFETITVTVNEVNSAPTLAVISDQTANEQQLFTFTPSASDTDLPAQTKTYTLVNGPETMTINTNTGTVSWTPTESDGPDTNQVTIRVSDSGSPKLVSERTFNVIVNEVNIAPVLHLGTSVITGLPITDLEAFPDGTINGTVLFRQPSFSASTSGFLESGPIWSGVTDVFPEGVAGSKVLFSEFAFKTGTVNPWLRFTTFNTTAGYAIPNPTVEFSKKVRFSIYSDRAIKVALGIRETGTSAAIGADGGTAGTIEWVGATLNGTSPVPSRDVEATNWTTLEFDMTSDTITGFPGSGNGTLSSATGKGVLEHLAIVPNDGSGVYQIYVDNFEVLVPSVNFVTDTGKKIVMTNGATDADLPAQALTFSLEPNAPTNAVIDSKSGTFEWTPTAEQSGTTNTFGIRVTDDGDPTLSDVENVTIVVNTVNTAPRMVFYLKEFFVNPNETVEYGVLANDDDLPGDTLTYSFTGSYPAGATINSTNGIFTWTPTTANGTNYAIVRVTDSGTPALFDELTIVVVVSPTNSAPILSLSTARATEPVVNYETFTNATPNEQVMFKKPANSATTTNYIDLAATNYTSVTTTFPAGNANAGAKVMRIDWSFKTGTTGYWVRLTTLNTTYLPNPTFNASAKLKFDVYTTKSLRIGLGIRETGTSAENGANGGSTGTIEYVGVTNVASGTPQPTRTVNASNWTTLEFTLPIEPAQGFTGDGILSAGQQVLEHLALVGNGGTGAYSVYVDNFEVVTETAMPGTVTMKSGSILNFTASGSDPDAHAISFGLEEGAPLDATINSLNGAFSWIPTTAYNDTTNEITPYVEDAPPGGYQTKRNGQTVTVIVANDAVGPQTASGIGAIAAGESITLEWNAVAGTTYQVQYKESLEGAWINIGDPIVAAAEVESVVLDNAGSERFYRITEVSGSSSNQ